MKDFKKDDTGKIMGAIISSIVFSGIFLFFIGLFTYIRLSDETFPKFLYIFLVIFFGFPIIGIIVNLIKRIKEIKGGEENEARKY